TNAATLAEAKSKGEITYSFVSLGCPKNLVDSERMLGLLQLDGYRLVGDPQGADFVIVNTCGFIERAREESYGTIREMLELKRQGAIKASSSRAAWPNARRKRCWRAARRSTTWSASSAA